MTTLDPREIAFRHFWDRYPLKLAIAEARVAFAQALKIASAEDLILGAQRFAQDPNRDPAYTVYPAKWLNGQRWHDGALPPRKLTPQEQSERDLAQARSKEEREKARSEAISMEFEEAKARAKANPRTEATEKLLEEARERIRQSVELAKVTSRRYSGS